MAYRIAHASLWSEEKARDVFWKLFKHSFVYLAIRAYAESGYYPRRRQDIVEHYASEELNAALETLNTIDEQPKEKVVSATRGLVEYIQQLIFSE